MVTQLMRTRAGRIGLDTFQFHEIKTKAQGRALLEKLKKRYGTTKAGLLAVSSEVKYIIASDGQKCL